MENYKAIAALDFELFNTKHYWSICWAGILRTDVNFGSEQTIEFKTDPCIKKKFVGKCMNFPYEYDFFSSSPTFKEVYQQFFDAVDGCLVVGHAVENDLRMLLDACKKFGLLSPCFDFIDTNVMYGEVKKLNAQHSLTALAEEFDIAFSAHNPVEDARATLEITKRLCGGDLKAFIKKHNITVGRLENNLIRRSVAPVMTDKQKQRIKNYNKVFAAAKKLGQGEGKSYHFVPSIACEQDISAVAEKILLNGGALCHDIYCADFVVTQNVQAFDDKEISFKALISELGLPLKNYKFARPQKPKPQNNTPTAEISG